MSNPVYIFDINGTLTRPNESIEDIDAFILKRFARDKNVYLFTEYEPEELFEFFPKEILDQVHGVFFNKLNLLYSKGKFIISKIDYTDLVLEVRCSDIIQNNPISKLLPIDIQAGLDFVFELTNLSFSWKVRFCHPTSDMIFFSKKLSIPGDVNFLLAKDIMGEHKDNVVYNVKDYKESYQMMKEA